MAGRPTNLSLPWSIEQVPGQSGLQRGTLSWEETIKKRTYKKWSCQAGEMAQRLRALAALPEVLSSIPSNHMVAHNHL